MYKNIAEIYALSRPPYPKQLLELIVAQLSVTHNQRYVDLGCGTGELLIPFSSHFKYSIGVDPEQDMLSVAARKVAKVPRDIELVHSTAERYLNNLPDDVTFDFVTAGRSFHWMDQNVVVDELAKRLKQDGIFAILGEADGGLWRRKAIWAKAVHHIIFNELDHKEPFVPPMTKIKASFQDIKNAMACLGSLYESTIEIEQEWTIENIINLFYSAAGFLAWLGDDKKLFENKVYQKLQALESSGIFTTTSTFGVTYVVRD